MKSKTNILANTILVILVLIINYQSFGQEVRMIDTKRVLKNTPEYKSIEKNYKSINDSILEKTKELVNDLRQRYQEYADRCLSPNQVKKYENEILTKREVLLEYDKFIKDTLPLFRLDLIDSIYVRINLMIAEFSKVNEINVVVKKSSLTYYDEQFDITDKIIELYLFKFIEEKYVNKWNEIVVNCRKKYRIENGLNHK